MGVSIYSNGRREKGKREGVVRINLVIQRENVASFSSLKAKI